ncbi:MAG: DUF2892 domain-containing protein [Caldisericaceae bacterium]
MGAFLLPNENNLDRTIRIIVGLLLIGLSVFANLNGTLKIVFIVIGAIALITGLTGFCLLYKVFNFSTKK